MSFFYFIVQKKQQLNNFTLITYLLFSALTVMLMDNAHLTGLCKQTIYIVSLNSKRKGTLKNAIFDVFCTETSRLAMRLQQTCVGRSASFLRGTLVCFKHHSLYAVSLTCYVFKNMCTDLQICCFVEILNKAAKKKKCLLSFTLSALHIIQLLPWVKKL